MKKTTAPSELPAGIMERPETNLAEREGKNTAIATILETREVRQALATILPDILNVIAGDSRFKRANMKMVGRFLSKGLSRPRDISEVEELAPLFDDSQFVKHLADPMPDLVNGLFHIIITLTKTLEEMPAAEKKNFIGDVIAKITTGQTGDIINQSCRIIKDIHKEDPEFFANALAPGFQKWVESADFGEIREMLNTSAEDGQAFLKMVNHVFWLYPSKVVMLLSMAPSLVNLITDTLDIFVGRFNDEMPPDMLTDVSFSLAKDINMDSVANVFNQLTELVRKIHVGSALLGEGTPLLPLLLSDIIGQIIDKTDPITLWKAKIALAETKATISQVVAKSVNNRSDFKHLSMIKGPEITNIHLKSLNARLAEWDALDDGEVAESFAQHIAAYDVQEMAEVLNNTLRIINRLGDERPAIFSEFTAQLVNAIDDYELAETAKQVFNGVSSEFKPAARAVVPGLVTWICDVLQPEDDEYEDDAEKARDALRSLLVKVEA